jgi:hypothetical protein
LWGSLVQGRVRTVSEAPPLKEEEPIEKPPTEDLTKYIYEVVDFPVWAITGVPCSFKIVSKDDQGIHCDYRD